MDGNWTKLAFACDAQCVPAAIVSIFLSPFSECGIAKRRLWGIHQRSCCVAHPLLLFTLPLTLPLSLPVLHESVDVHWSSLSHFTGQVGFAESRELILGCVVPRVSRRVNFKVLVSCKTTFRTASLKGSLVLSALRLQQRSANAGWSTPDCGATQVVNLSDYEDQ